MENYVNWIASAATMIAAMMTAANLGTRVTGWGFVIFTIGSIAWASVGLLSGQTSLLVTNSFLFLVNVFGVWRWLGRQYAYEEGGAAAIERSRTIPNVPTLFSGSGLIGATVNDLNGKAMGTIVDCMLACDTKKLSYLVITQGGLAGAGEELRAICPEYLDIDGGRVRCRITPAQVASLKTIDNGTWPVKPPSLATKTADHK